MYDHKNPITIDPVQFYELVGLAESFDANLIQDTSKLLEDACFLIDEQVREITEAFSSMVKEAQYAHRTKNPFEGKKSDDEWLKDFGHSVGGGNFVSLSLAITKGIQHGFHALRDTVQGVKPVRIVDVEGGRKLPKTREEFRDFALTMEMNQARLAIFISAVLQASSLKDQVVGIARGVVTHLDRYHHELRQRHTTGGMKIYGDPIRTDLAISIYENVDAHGEIEDGKGADELSAYSVRKATLLADSLQGGIMGGFVQDPTKVIDFLIAHLGEMWHLAQDIEDGIELVSDKVRKIAGRRRTMAMEVGEFNEALRSLKELDPRNIVAKDKVGLLSAEEQRELDYRNETIGAIADMLGQAASKDIIAYVTTRKVGWYKEQRDQNSFFVCKIGAGNGFLGEAPGALEVVAGVKPKVTLDEVVGQGFDEVRNMIAHAKNSSEWNDLFRATSPSRKVDKMNVLLVGPMGCGKTEALRALGSERGSIGIFAQASDFLTCWKGEAERNPKRLFEAGLKLHKETGRQVFFLIDEIDTILNGDRGQAAFGGTNLATEFQVLMDGITSYPGLAVWGATNHPERIPMPLIRRFAKVLVVGELEQSDRATLLRRFLSYLPQRGFSNKTWDEAAKLLAGAVGDTVRKVTDNVWREKMLGYVEKHPEPARKAVQFLQSNGTKFDPASFTSDQRGTFTEMIRPHVEVTPNDLMASIAIYLNNVAIKQEIITAVQTYETSRQYLQGMVKS